MPTDGHLDRVTLQGPHGHTTTIEGDLPYNVAGFHWQFVTPMSERLTVSQGNEAAGVIDGDIVARGYVDDVLVDTQGVAEVYVSPP